jgi:LysR family carnitine catabolism transcriptional activator
VPAETPTTIREAVRSGTAELGLTDEEPSSGELAVDLVTDQEFLAVLPPGSAAPEGGVLPLRTLLGMELVTGPVGTTVRDFLTVHAAELGSEFTPVVEVALRGSAAYLAIAGAGVAVLPLPMAEMCRSYGVVIVPLDPSLRRNVYLLRRTGSLSPAARAMRALLLPDT